MIAQLVPWMQSRAAALDRDAAFPTQEIDRLRQAGALAPLPKETLATTLIAAGTGNLSVGRILEAHVNALHLIALYGSPEQRPPGLVALWVTDPPTGGLRMRRVKGRITLHGGKQFCSAAGHADAALITAEDDNGETRMLVVKLRTGERTTPLPSPLSGMRAAVTGAVDFTGCEITEASILGQPSDYLLEPEFSSGAWRGSAVALGGLIALIDHAIQQAKASGRLDNPHAQARFGQAMIARETSRMWVARAAQDTTVATVGLARIAVETACLDAMRLIQRTLGLSSFRQDNPVELICRDLGTYLRQPAPDEVLTEAAMWFAGQTA